jgi:hypothetical protein
LEQPKGIDEGVESDELVRRRSTEAVHRDGRSIGDRWWGRVVFRGRKKAYAESNETV